MNKQKALDSIPAAPPSPHPKPEVVAQAKRLRFSPEYKLRILTEADQAKGVGGVGALLRREGLYSSLLTNWRRERNTANLQHKHAAPNPSSIPSPQNSNNCDAKISASPKSCAKPKSSSISKKSGRTLGADQSVPQPRRKTLMNAVAILAPTVGIAAACDFLDVPRASYYRQHPILGPVPQPLFQPLRIAPTVPARALRPDERQAVRDLLNSPRFQDVSPAAIQATLLDEGQYLCSTRTMYRLLQTDGATRERRDQCVHRPY